MKDRIALLLTGLCAAAVAWAFWWYFGARAFDLMNIAVILILWTENRRLRKRLSGVPK